MIISASPSFADAVSAGYEAFRAMLAGGNVLFGSDEVAIGADRADPKRYIEFGLVDDRALPVAITDLRLEICEIVRRRIDLIAADLLPGLTLPLASLIDWTGSPILRMTWYPPSAAEETNHPHTDIDLFTVLPHATQPGLELWSEDEWRPANPGFNEVLVLPGDMLEHFGGVPAVRHRVVGRNSDRISASLFVNADPRLKTPAGVSVSELFAQRLAVVRAAKNSEN